MKNFLTFAWAGLAILSLVGTVGTILAAGGAEARMAGVAIRGLYMIITPLTLLTTGLIYRFILGRTGSTGVGVVGIIHFVIMLIGTLIGIAASVFQMRAISGSLDNYETVGVLFAISGAFSLLAAISFLIAVIIALNSKDDNRLANSFD